MRPPVHSLQEMLEKEGWACYTGLRFGKRNESMTIRFIRSEVRSEAEGADDFGENAAWLFRVAE